jgi:hypothetical protein
MFSFLCIILLIVDIPVVPLFLLNAMCKRIGGVMVSVLALSAVDRGFEHRSGQPKAYKIGIYCFSDLAHSIKETIYCTQGEHADHYTTDTLLS